MKTRRAALALLLPAVFVPSCQNTGRVTDDTALDGPMMGAADETSFTIGGHGPVKLTDLVIIAKEIRKYRALNASEQEIIRRVVSLKLDGVAVKQMEQLKPRFEAKKKVVREQTQKRIADVKKRVRATTPAKSDAEIEKAPEVVQATRQIQVEEQQQITQIDDDLRQQARRPPRAWAGRISRCGSTPTTARRWWRLPASARPVCRSPRMPTKWSAFPVANSPSNQRGQSPRRGGPPEQAHRSDRPPGEKLSA